uniref:Fringe n=1 Tax=Panagrolaimus davidi TaxID=227884 RepID=A0A914QAF6_9BILA
MKTTYRNHATRISQIIDTWYKLSPENIYIITDAFDPQLNQTIYEHLITTNCGSNHDPGSLKCKLNQELWVMLKRNASWSCHVDDDNYVNIPKLEELLKEFDPRIPYYLGRTATQNPTEINGRTFWFAIGGTAVCISNAALKMMEPIIISEEKYHKYTSHDKLADDMAIGYIMGFS